MKHKSKIRNGLILLLVFIGGIIILGAALCAFLALTFLPLLFGMGANAGYLYYFGIGLAVACIFGTHIYYKMLTKERKDGLHNNRDSCGSWCRVFVAVSTLYLAI